MILWEPHRELFWADVPCDACGAERDEPCRQGCLGYAIEHDEITEPCS